MSEPRSAPSRAPSATSIEEPSARSLEEATRARSGDRRIVVRGLTRRFGDTLALAPLELEVGPGGVTGLLGPNGSGKSTLMRCLAGLVRADDGTACVDGVPLAGDGTALRRRLTYAPGELHLYGEMRAAEHLTWFLRGRADEVRARARAEAIAAHLGLPLRARVRTFSHGMKRQLVLAAALGPDVGVRILDEPTEGLDPSKRGAVLELLREDAAAGTTILLSSHHMGEVDRVCDRLVFMNAGAMLADERAQDLRERARRFVHLTFAEPPGADLAATVAAMGAELVRADGVHAALRLPEADPRPFLSELARGDLSALARNPLPAPVAIEYGRMSLVDLYRDLYGVEGV